VTTAYLTANWPAGCEYALMKTITLHLTEIEACTVLAGLKLLSLCSQEAISFDSIKDEFLVGWDGQHRLAIHDFKVAGLEPRSSPRGALITSVQRMIALEGLHAFGNRNLQDP